MADNDALTPQEQAFFDQRGEVEAPEAAPAEVAPAEQEVVLEVAAEPESAPAAEAPPPEKHQTVPLAVLMEERAKAKEWRAQLEQERLRDAAERAKLQERLDILARAYQPKEQPAPSFDDDPVAATVHGFQQTGEVVKSLQEKLDQIEKRSQAEQMERQITSAAVMAEQQFKASAPDYDSAIEHLVNARGRELAALGYQGPQIIEIMKGERSAVLQQSLQSGRNPAQVLYELAKVRGYAPKAAPPKPEQKMDALEAGAKAASGIDNVAGRQAKSISIQSLIEMDDDEFYKLSSSPKAFRRLFGEA